jgi:hypothetical protein
LKTAAAEGESKNNPRHDVENADTKKAGPKAG